MAKKTNTAAAVQTRTVLSDAYKALTGHFAEVTGGRKIEHGTKVAVIRVFVNRFNTEVAQVKRNVSDDTTIYINPKFLKKGKPLPEAQKAAIDAENEANNRPILAPFYVMRLAHEKNADGTPKDGGDVTAMQLDHDNWPRGIWFPVEMVEQIAKITEGTRKGQILYTVPAFKIRREFGDRELQAMSKAQAALRKEYGLKDTVGSDHVED